MAYQRYRTFEIFCEKQEFFLTVSYHMHENVAAAAIDLLLPNVVDGLCQLSMFVFKFPNVVSKIFMGRPKAIYEGFVR